MFNGVESSNRRISSDDSCERMARQLVQFLSETETVRNKISSIHPIYKAERTAGAQVSEDSFADEK